MSIQQINKQVITEGRRTLKMKRMLSIVLAASLCLSTLTGCEGLYQKLNLKDIEKKEDVKLNEKVSADSKWINAEIEGAIDENSQLNLKDDFYAAHNKKWLVNTKADDAHIVINSNNSDEITNLRLLGIIKGEDDEDANGDAPVPADYAMHDEKQIRILSDALMDWDERNANSLNELRKYADYIEAIDSIDTLNEYLIGNNGQNLMQIDLVGFQVDSPKIDAENRYVYVDQITTASLPLYAYTNGDSAAMSMHNLDEKTGYILRRLGYSDDEIKALFKKCFKFEAGLLDHVVTTNEKYYEQEKCIETSTVEEIQSLAGDYPITDILKAYGFENSRLVVINPAYLKYISKQMNIRNLENIKAYLLVNTVSKSAKLLDKEAYDYFRELELRDSKLDEELIADDAITPLDNYYLGMVQKYMMGMLDTVYVAKYCTEEEKEDLQNITSLYINKFSEIFESEDWITDDTKEAAQTKLSAIKQNVLYPDEFVEYDYIDIGEGGSLLDIVADINADKRMSDAATVNEKVDRASWNFDEVPTTTYNCGYIQVRNSINLFAGFFADKDSYRIDMPMEEKLAKVGSVIGHEITHGFDTNGAKYDELGYKRDWWAKIDKQKFDARNSKITDLYESQYAYPGKKFSISDALKVRGEVAADLGGIKCSLEIGKDLGDFDNKAFFEYYAESWRQKLTMKGANYMVGDEHPMNWVRINVNLMQFDEFVEAFDIKEGDGMYLDPEKRINVW